MIIDVIKRIKNTITRVRVKTDEKTERNKNNTIKNKLLTST